MSKQKHDIGHQKRLRREEEAQRLAAQTAPRKRQDTREDTP